MQKMLDEIADTKNLVKLKATKLSKASRGHLCGKGLRRAMLDKSKALRCKTWLSTGTTHCWVSTFLLKLSFDYWLIEKQPAQVMEQKIQNSVPNRYCRFCH